MFIEVTKDRVYGNVLHYPVCQKAKLFARIAGSKTLTEYTMHLIKQMGYEIRLVI